MTTPTRTSAAILDEVVSALRRGDLSRAEQALAGGPVDAEGLTRLAELNLRRQRWADAAWLFDRISGGLPPSLAFKRNLCRNFASLSIHRPDLCRLLASLPPSDVVTIAPSGTGHPTIAVKQSDGVFAGLSSGNRPLAAAEGALQQLRPALGKGLATGLAGLGDGYLLYRLATEDSKLFLSMQAPVFVIEPDPHIALHALMIHDYSGPTGPIEQQRFVWFIGPDWEQSLRAKAIDDLYLGLPAVTIGFTDIAATIRTCLAEITQEAADRDLAMRDRVAAYYDSYDPSQLQSLLEPTRSRPPRLALLTTQFSTVLQYSTRDAAAAFSRLGWDARVWIEPSAAHRLHRAALRRELEVFKPDLVFQIDHLRHEHEDLFPPNLPFVCWIQDHLTHLTSPAAGRQVDANQFVLTDAVPTCVRDYQYPGDQCIALTKLTNVRSEAKTPSNQLEHVEDVVFVSNASQLPAVLLEVFVATLTKDSVSQHVALETGRRIAADWADGQRTTTYVQVRQAVEATCQRAALKPPADFVREMSAWLYHPYVDAIYRQEALGWAAQACAELGLSLGLYGRGWESHPTLSPFARGPIQNGPPLHELTRRAIFNLQIVPYQCLHQRLLDGLSVGGSFLIRSHLADTSPALLLNHLVAHGNPAAPSVSAARQSLAAASIDVQSRFELLLADFQSCACASGQEDAMEYLQSWRAARMVLPEIGVLPHFDDVSFSSAVELRAKMQSLLNDAERRQQIAADQRQSVQARFTYDAGMADVAREIAARLARRRDTINSTATEGLGQAA